MNQKTIGILGGAGPMAGLSLVERLIGLCQSRFGCKNDADFPKMLLLSFPFSDMLSSKVEAGKVKKELSDALFFLKKSGASVIAIACNTLHAFLDEKEVPESLIHLPKMVASEIGQEKPLVLCTSTSRKARLHERFFPCRYPKLTTQKGVDEGIAEILEGREKKAIVKKLEAALSDEKGSTLILGCTELSLLTELFNLPEKRIIDPLDIVAEKILEKIFNKKGEKI